VVRSLGREAVILHAMGVWGHAAARADALLAGRAARHAFVLGAYTTHVDETASEWRGLAGVAGWRSRAEIGVALLWSRALVSRYEAIAHRRAHRVLVNYRSVQRLVERRFGIVPEIVPYTVEAEYLDLPRVIASAPPRLPGTIRIVCVARHDPRKGIDVLLRALAHLKRAGVAFSAQLLSGGALLEAHRAFARALDLDDRVAILGIVPCVEPYLGEADIFVLPAREEQSGSLALLEAMRAGIACVASGCDGIPEDARHRTDAWLTAPGEVQSLVDGLHALIGDASLRRMLAEGARKRFEERFSAAAMTSALDRVYRQAVARPAPRREFTAAPADALPG
jgi:glycosyltransferase involved in cell wall biosynthesis